MSLSMYEIKSYQGFDELAKDVLDLAKEILPGKLVYINSLTNEKQITLKIAGTNEHILLKEGMVIPVNDGLCNRCDFENEKPLIYEDLSVATDVDDLRDSLKSVNINAYMGIPISLVSGEKFGTLCAAYHEKTHFDDRSIHLLQKLAKMFSYYLEIEHLAYRDILTGVYNRQYLYQFQQDILGEKGTLISLDLDGFKRINDLIGHDQGDEVLKELGYKLKQFESEIKDSFAVRMGGDEFLFYMRQCVDQHVVEQHVKRMIQTFSSWDTALEGQELTCSLGVSIHQKIKPGSLELMLKESDQALYKAKRAGKNRYIIAMTS